MKKYASTDPEDVVYEFIEAWTDGEYEFAYELLSSDSELREGLSQEEWIERRRTWAEQAQPKELLIAFVREREEGKANLKLPTASVGNHSAKTREVEISWSLELKDTSAGETLKEMSVATAIYNETGRHWFWTSYTFVEEEDEWRIQNMTDQGANAQKLPVEELKSRIEQLDAQLKELVRKKKLAEDQLHQAGALATEDDQKALIEFALGDIAKEREQFEQALHHYQHAVEFDPTSAEAWLNLGRSQHTLGQILEAEVSFKRSIELDPNDYHAYSSLGKMYLESEQWSKAREILEQGLLVNQDSADLRVYLAIVLMAIGEHRSAEKLLDEAEEIDPDLEFIQTVRQSLKRSSSQKPDSRNKKRSRR